MCVCVCVCRIDIAEAHYAQISVLCLSGLLGPQFWTNLFPGLGLELKVLVIAEDLMMCERFSAGSTGIWDNGVHSSKPSSCSLYRPHMRSGQEWFHCCSKCNRLMGTCMFMDICSYRTLVCCLQSYHLLL